MHRGVQVRRHQAKGDLLAWRAQQRRDDAAAQLKAHRELEEELAAARAEISSLREECTGLREENADLRKLVAARPGAEADGSRNASRRDVQRGIDRDEVGLLHAKGTLATIADLKSKKGRRQRRRHRRSRTSNSGVAAEEAHPEGQQVECAVEDGTMTQSKRAHRHRRSQRSRRGEATTTVEAHGKNGRRSRRRHRSRTADDGTELTELDVETQGDG